MTSAEPSEHHCFISHCYGDAAAVAACVRRRLPGGAIPFVFPPITVGPDQAVSAALIDAIRACGRFLYVDTPQSLDSFWVGFERNIAARIGKPVHAFKPHKRFLAFSRDRSEAVDPIVAILVNLAVQEDADMVQRVRATIWDRYRFEIRGDQWKRLDNDPRQMLDSVDGLARKYHAGGVALLFLSNRSICGGFHDYIDPGTFRRANRDMETPFGYTGEKFAALDPARTITIWLEAPDRDRIEASLARFNPELWAPYVAWIRAALAEPGKLVVGRAGGELDLNHLDTMLARCFWTALGSDPRLAASFRKDVLGLSAPAR